MIGNTHFIAAIAALALLVPCATFAGTEPHSTDGLEAGLANCAAISSAQQRLGCYDSLAGRQSPTPAAKSGAAAAVPAAAASATSAQAVAPAVDPKFGLKEAPPKQDPVSLTARVTAMTQSLQGRVVVTLDNGQRWEFQGPDAALGTGDVVSIATASLGSFLMTTPARHKLRVRRIS